MVRSTLQGEQKIGALILIALAWLLAGCTANALAVTLEERPAAAATLADNDEPQTERHRALQALLDAAHLDQTVYHKYDQILVRWPEDIAYASFITLRIQKADGRIYSERQAFVEPGTVINLGDAYVLRDGHYNIVLMPPVSNYYLGGLHVDRKLPIEIRVQQP